jgi:O-antigen/teichoic acid export membrane protein
MKRTIVRGTVLVLTMRWGDRLLGMVSTLILARILVPGDFGVVAMASLAVGLVDILLDLGVGTALVRRSGFDPETFSTAWTIRLLQSALVAAVVVAASGVVADYFGDPRVVGVLHVMAAAMLVAGFENIGVVNFQKEMQFGKELQFFLLRRLAGFFATVALALLLRNYWALPFGMLAGRIAGVALSYRLHPFRPRLTLAHARSLWSVSQWLLVRSVGGYVDARLDKALIGRRFDATVLGTYSVADDLSALPSTELLAPVGRVLYPVLVQAREDAGRMAQTFALALALQAMIAVPMAVGLAVVAPEATLVLLGSRWSAATPYVQVLALVYGVGALSHAAGYVLLTLGRMRAFGMLIWTQVAAFALVALVVVPTATALDLAWFRLGTGIIGVVGTLLLAVRAMRAHLTFGRLFALVWRSFAAAAIMAGCVLAVRGASGNPAAALLIECLVGAAVYVAVLLALWVASGRPTGAESHAIDTARALVAR